MMTSFLSAENFISLNRRFVKVVNSVTIMNQFIDYPSFIYWGALSS